LNNIEIILVDDGSTDGSSIILKEFMKLDKRVILIQQENMGPGPARNAGLAIARGDYLAILDADDIYNLNMLEEMYRKAQNEDCDIVVCDFQQLDSASGKIMSAGWGINYRDIHHCETYSPQEMAKKIFQTHMLWAWDKLFKREFVLRYSCFFPSLYGPEDSVFVTPLLLMAERIGIVNKVFVTYRTNVYTSVSNTRSKSVYDYAKAIVLIKDFMVKYNIYGLYEQSFINWSLMYCLWSMKGYIERHTVDETLADSFQEVFNYNKNSFFGELGLDTYSEGYFYNNTDYWQYKAIMSMSFHHYVLQWVADQRECILDLERSRSESILNLEQSRTECILNFERSRSWRIGRAITWLPRKLRGFIYK
jgi:glycosyltransferase involved in cell wall biosynthesis